MLVTGFDRPNLFLDVRRPADKFTELLRFLRSRPDKSGIVYCATRSAVEQVCAKLREAGFPAVQYHAGLPDAERRRAQEDFQYDRAAVMVATNAFGMGIDKSNVAYVVHYNMPKSLEAYYQEAGRAGRDGSPADCLLLYSPSDIITARFLIEHSGENEELGADEREALRRRDMDRLNSMVEYCRTGGCLRGCILGYFGQEHPESCGACANCRSGLAKQDVTVQAQMLLSCVKRVRSRLGYGVGRTLIIQVLRGSREARVLELGLDKLSTYGLLRGSSAEGLYALVDRLEELGYLRTEPKHHVLELTPKPGTCSSAGRKWRCTCAAPRRAQSRRAKNAPPPPCPPPAATSTRPCAPAYADRSRGGGSALRRLFQRHARRHGREDAERHGRVPPRLRRGRKKGEKIRRALPGRHCKILQIAPGRAYRPGFFARSGRLYRFV